MEDDRLRFAPLEVRFTAPGKLWIARWKSRSPSGSYQVDWIAELILRLVEQLVNTAFANSIRFGPSLRYIELPIELITATVLQELGSKCPNLTHMLLDFSTAMQLHDFNELQGFPTKLRYMCICLSEVIFMEGFMRKIYSFINGLEILHLIGTVGAFIQVAFYRSYLFLFMLIVD